jgi:hypothetical protein
MSTRSLIARKTENGFESIYCHFDGYPDHHAPILREAYWADERVSELLALGSLSILGRQIGVEHDFNTHINNPDANDWCLAYGRDRKDRDTEKSVCVTEEELLRQAEECWAEYVYLFQNGKWTYRPVAEHAEWRELP